MASLGILLVLVLALFVAVLAVVVWGVRRASSTRRGDEAGAAAPAGAGAHTVRRFFQYALIYAMTVLAANGISNLLARAMGSSRYATDQAGRDWEARLLAQDVTFALVGSAVLAALVWWTWRSLRRDPREAQSPAFAVVVTATALTALVAVITNVHTFIGDLARNLANPADATAPALVWGVVWAATWVIAQRALPATRRLPHRAVGSTVGLVAMTWGFTDLLSTALRILVDGSSLVGGRADLVSAGGLLLVGALVWIRYWILAAQSDPRSTWWLIHVLVVGVAGGLLLALSGGSLALWDVLVWVVGDPGGRSAASHFSSTPGYVATAVAGVIVWWYHRAAIAGAGEGVRSEVRRVYEYLVAGVALTAGAAGIGTLVVALIESLTPGQDVGMSVRNTLLAAVTLLVVGVPVWIVFWRRIQRAMAADPIGEGASPTRRIALVLVLGLSTVAAVIALIVVVMTLVQDLIAGDFSAATLSSARYGLGVLVAAAAVAGYHAAVWREDRQAVTRAEAVALDRSTAAVAPGPFGTEGVAEATVAPVQPEVTAPPTGAWPASVVLVGDVPEGLGHELARRTGARVEVWRRPGEATWDIEDLAARVGTHPGRDVLVIGEGPDLRVLEVERGS